MPADELDFAGKTALVVGGSTGIGNATAQLFRLKGASVHVWARRPAAADYADEPDSDMTGLDYHRVDVADFDAVTAFEPPFERLDALVLCQGHVLYGRREFALDGFREVVDVNLTSVMAVITRFEAMLREARGCITVVSSVAAFKSTIGNPAYAASKAGAVALVRTLAQSLAPAGVRVNGLAPGFVPTRMTRVTSEDQRRADATLARIPLGRFGAPIDMARICLFLSSPLASYVTGQTIICDGGLTL